MKEHKWVLRELLFEGSSHFRMKNILQKFDSAAVSDSQDYFFACQKFALDLASEKLDVSELSAIIEKKTNALSVKKQILEVLSENERGSVVFLDKKANILYSKSDNIIAVNEGSKSYTFVNNRAVNDDLLENLYDASADYDSNTKTISEFLKTKTAGRPLQAVDLTRANTVAIYSNYYQFLLSYDFFNIQEFDKQYHSNIGRDHFAKYMHNSIYTKNKKERFAFLLKKTRR